MEYNFYIYNKPECKLNINKMPIWFKEIEYEGDENNGYIILHSQKDYDEIWGPNAKLEIKWEKRERMKIRKISFFILHSYKNSNSLSYLSQPK